MIFFDISWFLWLLRNEKMFNNRIANYDFFLINLNKIGYLVKSYFFGFPLSCNRFIDLG